MMNWAQKRLQIWGLIGGLVLVPCHTAMGQCAILSLLDGPMGIQHWKVNPVGEQGTISVTRFKVDDSQGLYRFPHTIGDHNIHQLVSLEAKEYELTALVRTSPNMREGYLRVGLPKPLQKQFGPQTDFMSVSIKFTPAHAGS